MQATVKIEGGFAEVGAGTWLMGRGQPADFFGSAVRRRRKGFFLRDRSALDLVETTDTAKCADARRPFLTHIPCAAPISAASTKVLVAPAKARRDAHFVKLIPMSLKNALCVTVFGSLDDGKFGSLDDEKFGSLEGTSSKPLNLQTSKPLNFETSKLRNLETSHFVVMATASRTARIQVADGQTLSVRPEAVVAWTGRDPTGFCRRLSLWDVLLPRGPRDLLLTFYGPGVVWAEGANIPNFQTSKLPNFYRRSYGA